MMMGDVLVMALTVAYTGACVYVCRAKRKKQMGKIDFLYLEQMMKKYAIDHEISSVGDDGEYFQL